MRIAWLECATGISGDMTLAALVDAGVSQHSLREAIDSLKLPDVVLRVETVVKNGFRATQVMVNHPEQHAHRHLSDIREIIEGADAVTQRQKQLALQMFEVVAGAEARVHGTTMEQIHFHEVGAVDSIVDIVGVAVGFDQLNLDRLICNHVPTGRGFVNIDHGTCPVPAPATAEILKGIPLTNVPLDAELTTPTGAAIVRTLADSFGAMPAMTVDVVGCGAGTMTFQNRANVLRLFVGTAVTNADTETVMLLETNIDDVDGEILGFTQERLRASGALDVWLVTSQMKKNRPGSLLSVLCRPVDVSALEDILFRETGTLGIRRLSVERRVQHRDIVTVMTPWGEVTGKRSWRSGFAPTFAAEFEDCARVARECDVPLRDIYRAAESAFQQSTDSNTLSVSANDECVPDKDTHSHDHDHDHGK
jgi:pyridinium-3,5-bisthiocarboxylic acid mononucleotide nickel chelatase